MPDTTTQPTTEAEADAAFARVLQSGQQELRLVVE